MNTRREKPRAQRGATWVICSLVALALALGGVLHDADAGNKAGRKNGKPRIGGTGRSAPATGTAGQGKNTTQTPAEELQGAADASAQKVLDKAKAAAMKNVADSILDDALCSVGTPEAK